jgi:tRNA(Ile)-lysidine synthase
VEIGLSLPRLDTFVIIGQQYMRKSGNHKTNYRPGPEELTIDLHRGNRETLSTTMGIKENVKATIQRHELLSRGDRILVAVSGGPDSVALLFLLNELCGEFGAKLEVAHLQHGIRGEEAKEDARFVSELTESLKLPFHLKEIDLPHMKSHAGKGNLEAWARAERYRFFAGVVRECKLDKVATAHTEDDQAETVLMWLLRGTGMKGLGGMSPLHLHRVAAGDSMETLTVIRPLIEISKGEIVQYLEERKLNYRLDRSNLNTSLLRNWIRLELLPKIQQRVDSGFTARLSRQAELLRDEDSLLAELAQKSYESMRDSNGLSRAALLREPKALQRRILRHWIGHTRGHLRGLESVHIDDLLRLIKEGPAQGRLSIPGGWELMREYETLRLAKASRSLKQICYTYEFSIGTVLSVPEAGMQLYSKQVDGSFGAMPTEPMEALMEALFDLNELPRKLVVRNFRPGDRFEPLGMSGHKKVKDLFIDKKVPLSVRATLPLLTTGAEVLWIPGYGRSGIARVSAKTTSVLHIKAVSIGS